MDYLRPGDVLAVWKLDRLGRSLPDLIARVQAIQDVGCEFRSLTEAIDTTTTSGRLMFHLMGALAQFERDLIRERTLAGLAQAAAHGRRPRPANRDDPGTDRGGPAHARRRRALPGPHRRRPGRGPRSSHPRAGANRRP